MPSVRRRHGLALAGVFVGGILLTLSVTAYSQDQGSGVFTGPSVARVRVCVEEMVGLAQSCEVHVGQSVELHESHVSSTPGGAGSAGTRGAELSQTLHLESTTGIPEQPEPADQAAADAVDQASQLTNSVENSALSDAQAATDEALSTAARLTEAANQLPAQVQRLTQSILQQLTGN